MPSCEWVVWYDDGTSFCSLEGVPEAAPAWGVMCIAQASRDHGRVIWHGGDYYWRDREEWVRGDLAGLLDYVTRIGLAKVGRSVPTAHFRKCYQQAVDDPRLPPKTSLDALEA